MTEAKKNGNRLAMGGWERLTYILESLGEEEKFKTTTVSKKKRAGPVENQLARTAKMTS